MKLKGDLCLRNCTVRCRIWDGVSVHNVDKENFKELKKAGKADSYKGTRWVEFGGVTFFASDEDKED